MKTLSDYQSSNRKLKRALTFSIAFAALLLIGNAIQWRQKKNDEMALLLESGMRRLEISQNTAAIAQKQAAFDSLVKNHKVARLNDSLEIKAYKRVTENLQAKLKILPKFVPYNPDSATVDSLRVAFVLKDSVIASQDSTIERLELRHSAEIINLDKQIELQANQIMEYAANERLYTDELKKSAKDIKKQRNGKRFWQVTAGIVTGIALYIAVIK